MSLFYKHKTAFDIIKEADDDNTPDDAAGNDNTTDEAPSAEESDNDNAGDDLDIDTTLDDDGNSDNNDGGDDLDTGDDLGGGGDDTSSSNDGEDIGDDEVNDDNTDMYSTLTAEEQKIKISQLKKQFAALYASISDISDKIKNIDVDETNISAITRSTSTLYSLKAYIKDYMDNIFGKKSFVENDIMFNRLLSILNSVSVVIDELAKIKIANNK